MESTDVVVLCEDGVIKEHSPFNTVTVLSIFMISFFFVYLIDDVQADSSTGFVDVRMIDFVDEPD